MADSYMVSSHSINPEENNFVEIHVDSGNEDDNDENIEYVDYNEDDDLNDYVVLDDDDVIEEDDAVEADEFIDINKHTKYHIPKVERNHPSSSNNAILGQSTEELYHCSSCNTDFHSVADHINEFHKDQSVFFDELDINIEDQQMGSEHIKSEALSTHTQENHTIQQTKNDILENIVVKSEQTDAEDIIEYYTIDELFKEEHMDADEAEYIDQNDSRTKVHEEDNHPEEIYFDANGRPYIRKKVKIENTDLDRFHSKNKTSTFGAKVLKNESQDALHIEENASESELWFICPECDKKFQTERKLANHMRFHHKVQGYIKVKPRKCTDEQVVCGICNTIFPSNKSYRLHSRMHGPVKVRPIEEAIGYEMKSSMKDGKQTNETFFCDICNKSYDKSFEDVHIKSHKVGEVFMCTTCNKKFANEVSLSMHLKAHQENPKVKPPTKAELNGTTLPHECNYCGRQFARPHEKVKHERIHTGEKPYKCEICGKSFRVAYCLTLHLRTHTTARPYVCPHCNKRYKAYSGYNHHLMTHSDERPYKCPHCPKAFKTSVQLAGHKNSHTKPFSCPECNRPFASLYAVKAHMETHKRSSQTLKHRCPACGAIYARAFALKDHMKEQHQGNFIADETAEMRMSEVPFLNEAETSAQSILPDNVGEVNIITIDEMDHFQAEEVVTDWLK